MRDGTLRLNEKILSQGQQKALRIATNHFDQFVDKMVLLNNNLLDKDLGSLLAKLVELPKLQKLQISRNDIGPKTVKAISILLQKRVPRHLEDLEISDLKLKQ